MTTFLPQFDPLFEIVRVRVTGTVEDQHIGQCIRLVDQCLAANQCARLLIDWRDSILALSSAARPQRLAALAASAGRTRRVAMLYANVGARQRGFAQDCAALGVDVAVFASEWQALDWLREGPARSVEGSSD